MAYFYGKGTAGIQDPSIRQSLLSGLANGQNLFGGKEKPTAPAATAQDVAGRVLPREEFECNSGYEKIAGTPCQAGFVTRRNPKTGIAWCCLAPKEPEPGVCKQGAVCDSSDQCGGKPCDPTYGCQCADKKECVPDGPCKTSYDCVGKPCIGATATTDGKCDCSGAKRTCVPRAKCVDSDNVAHDNICGTGKCNATTGECECGEGPGEGPCVQDKTCDDDVQCGTGSCVNNKCECGESFCKTDADCDKTCGGTGTGVCTTEVDPETGANIKKCRCTGGKEKPVVEPGNLGKCPEGIGSKEYKGCACGKAYATMTGNCVEGYVFVARSGTGWHEYKKGAKGRCECVKYCEENGFGSDCQGGGTIGEYKYPSEMDALMKLMMARANALMQMPGGYTQAEINKMFGKGFEGIRGQQAGTRNQMEETLSREGMLGTGTATGAMGGIAREGESNVANLMRDIFLGNMGQKRQDLKDYTGLAQGIMGTGMGYEQLLEAINAARRGEKNNALMLLLQLLGLYKG